MVDRLVFSSAELSMPAQRQTLYLSCALKSCMPRPESAAMIVGAPSPSLSKARKASRRRMCTRACAGSPPVRGRRRHVLQHCGGDTAPIYYSRGHILCQQRTANNIVAKGRCICRCTWRCTWRGTREVSTAGGAGLLRLALPALRPHQGGFPLGTKVNAL